MKTQVLIYCLIPVIVVFIYIYYEVSYIPFFIWAAICLVTPVGGKLISGIKNYNDYFSLTDDAIEYNNEKAGVLPVGEISQIVLIKDEADVLHKLQVSMVNKSEVVIDLDEMELEAYLHTIEEFVRGHYKGLVK